MNLSQIRYYLNYVLPDLIKEKLYDLIDFFSNSLWWVFLLTTIVLIIVLFYLYKKLYNLYREREKINRFLEDISGIEDIKTFEEKIIEFRNFFKAKYIAFYTLKGETYVLQAHNVNASDKDVGDAGVNVYLVKKLIKIKSTSGNFVISTYVSKKNDFVLQVYAYKFINLKYYNGYIESVFGLYRKLLKGNEINMQMKLSTITKEVQSIINKSIFSGYGYIRYILTLVKNAISASCIMLYENGKFVFTIGEKTSDLKHKKFFIHNTGYFVDIYSEKDFSIEDMKKLGSFLDMIGIFISTFNKTNNIAKFYLEFLLKANEMFENQNKYYFNHSKKVAIISLEIGKALFYNEEQLNLLKIGALIHDIGMIADISNIIDKDSKLSKDEISIIKFHPLIGSILVEPISFSYPISPIIKYHHEKIDGTGYPFGLAGKEIPQEAQVVGLAEFFVGLISDRAYKKGMEIEKAKKLLIRSGDKMFDRVIIDMFSDSFDSIYQKFLKLDLEKNIKREKNEKKTN